MVEAAHRYRLAFMLLVGWLAVLLCGCGGVDVELDPTGDVTGTVLESELLTREADDGATLYRVRIRYEYGAAGTHYVYESYLPPGVGNRLVEVNGRFIPDNETGSSPIDPLNVPFLRDILGDLAAQKPPSGWTDDEALARLALQEYAPGASVRIELISPDWPLLCGAVPEEPSSSAEDWPLEWLIALAVAAALAFMLFASLAGRGERVLSSLWVVLRCVALLVVGGAGLWWSFVDPMIDYLDASSWVEVPCTILSREVDGDGGDGYNLRVAYHYAYEGRAYVSNRFGVFRPRFGTLEDIDRRAKDIRVGRRLSCRVNPDDPAEAVLTREFEMPVPRIFVAVTCAVMLLMGLFMARAVIAPREDGEDAPPEPTAPPWGEDVG